MEIEPFDGGLAVSGELDAAAAEHFDVTLQEALLESSGAFILDLSELTFMDSGGVNELVRARSLLGREERELAVVCPDGPVRRVLGLIGVADLFALFPTRADAEAALVPAD
jgi:anti-sigma B factor antagonist